MVAPPASAAASIIAARLFLYLMFVHFSLLMNIMTRAATPRPSAIRNSIIWTLEKYVVAIVRPSVKFVKS